MAPVTDMTADELYQSWQRGDLHAKAMMYEMNTRISTRDDCIAQLEAEILRLRTTEAAAAHALDTIRQYLGLDLVQGEHPSVTRQRIEADLAAVRAERDEYKAALLRTDATVIKYRDEYDEDSQMLREISHDIDGTLMRFDPEFATPDLPAAAHAIAEWCKANRTTPPAP